MALPTRPTDPAGTPGPAAERLLAAASAVRAAARQVATLVTDLAAYDRDDVWQGARADELRAGRLDHERALLGPITGAVPALDDAARRIEQRAAAVAADDRGVCDLPR